MKLPSLGWVFLGVLVLSLFCFNRGCGQGLREKHEHYRVTSYAHMRDSVRVTDWTPIYGSIDVVSQLERVENGFYIEVHAKYHDRLYVSNVPMYSDSVTHKFLAFTKEGEFSTVTFHKGFKVWFIHIRIIPLGDLWSFVVVADF